MGYRGVVVGALLSGLLFVSSTSTVQAEGPLEMVRETVNAVLAVLRDKSLQGPANVDRRREKLRQVVFQRFGFEEIAQRAVGQYWQKLPREQQQEFVDLFGELYERSWTSKISDKAGKQTVRYIGETIKDGYASVETEVKNTNYTVFQVVYLLRQRDGNWQIYDVKIEGVSQFDSYYQKAHTIISQESYEALLKRTKLKHEQERAADPVKR